MSPIIVISVAKFFPSLADITPRLKIRRISVQLVYPVPQNATHIRARMDVLDQLKGQHREHVDLGPWYGVYRILFAGSFFIVTRVVVSLQRIAQR